MKTFFISSTFKDMQYERDCLNTQVLPRINAIAKQYGDGVAFCDLRWGINTYSMSEEQSNIKILVACLHEIDNCRPYMIVFLGQRYGWLPGERLVKRVVDECSERELSDYDISATALEIEYGPFQDPQQFSHTLFYFRENDEHMPEGYTEYDAELREKLTALKKRITSVEGAHVYSYSLQWNADADRPDGLDALANRIIRDASALLADEWAKTAGLTVFERESRMHWSFAQKNAASYYSRGTVLDTCHYLLDNCQRMLCVLGGDGNGKTALFGKLACDKQKGGMHVLPIFCGLTEGTNHTIGVTKHIIGYLKETFVEPFAQFDLDAKGDAEYWGDRFAEAMRICSRIDTKIAILIDGVDVLCDDCLTSMPFFCEKLPYNVSLFYSSATKEIIPNGCPILYSTASTDFFDTKHILENRLTGVRKELDDAVLQEIACKKSSRNPLYLKLVLQRLMLLNRTDFYRIAENGGDIAAIIAYQIKLIRECGDSLQEMCAQLICVACEKVNSDLGKYIADYLCASDRGLREESFRKLLEYKQVQWSPIDFRIVMQLLEELVFIRGNGSYDIMYHSIKDAYAVPTDVYVDLMWMLETQGAMSDDDVAAYIAYCLCANAHRKYLRFILANPAKWRIVAASTFHTIQYRLRRNMDTFFLERWLVDWVRGVMQDAPDADARRRFEDFFRHEYNKACTQDVAIWRIMAKELYGDWDTVNRYQCPSDAPRRQITPVYEKEFNDLCKRWKNAQDDARSAIRREHLIATPFREHEFLLGGHLFYFFNVPRADDKDLFFMRDDCVLLHFSRSSVGDHCTYDVRVGEDGALTVVESDFCHYDVESDVNIYRYDDPTAENPRYVYRYESRKGAYNLPLHFTIKR